jgi:hypothetical protein
MELIKQIDFKDNETNYKYNYDYNYKNNYINVLIHNRVFFYIICIIFLFLYNIKSKDVSESLSEDVSESLSKDVSESLSKDVSESLSKDVSESLSKDVSESLSVHISKYTDKSYVIRGSKTKDLKEVFKKLDCRWNYNLKNGPGWIISNKKLDKLQQELKNSKVKYNLV